MLLIRPATVSSDFGALLPDVVPAHPIAGAEKSGVEAAFAELYIGRKVVLTPLPVEPVAEPLPEPLPEPEPLAQAPAPEPEPVAAAPEPVPEPAPALLLALGLAGLSLRRR